MQTTAFNHLNFLTNDLKNRFSLKARRRKHLHLSSEVSSHPAWMLFLEYFFLKRKSIRKRHLNSQNVEPGFMKGSFRSRTSIRLAVTCNLETFLSICCLLSYKNSSSVRIKKTICILKILRASPGRKISVYLRVIHGSGFELNFTDASTAIKTQLHRITSDYSGKTFKTGSTSILELSFYSKGSSNLEMVVMEDQGSSISSYLLYP